MSGHVDIDEAVAGLNALNDQFLIQIEMYVSTAAVKLQGEAANSAPWQDRTGDARKRLKGSYEKLNKGFLINLSHGVDYGVYLELAMEKNYAILWPTIDREKDAILQGFNGLLDTLTGKLGV